ncbi:hypothetical protein [Flexivirga caeni]|uniref:PepSY domain-containing protein n=1 Tax=Flexivirga caeni TaxID=2294115 RepID=A0A3M9M569_9MICO|nr:hypothetical protein [Flexivirga caeni]RNI20646.1 hypothetical protein EFY87_13710 [Flexivirga caeni]
MTGKRVSLMIGFGLAGAVVLGGTVSAGEALAAHGAGPTPSATTQPARPAFAPHCTGGPDFGPGRMRPASKVTGTELAKVTAAVKAKKPRVQVKAVLKGRDGTYFVLGTDDGKRAFVTVDKNLTSVTEHTGGPGPWGPGGPGSPWRP